MLTALKVPWILLLQVFIHLLDTFLIQLIERLEFRFRKGCRLGRHTNQMGFVTKLVHHFVSDRFEKLDLIHLEASLGMQPLLVMRLGEGLSTSQILELVRQMAGLLCFTTLFGPDDQLLGGVHEEDASLSLDASETAFSNELVYTFYDVLLVFQDGLVVNFVDKVGALCQDSERVALKSRPFLDDSVVMTVADGPVWKEKKCEYREWANSCSDPVTGLTFS